MRPRQVVRPALLCAALAAGVAGCGGASTDNSSPSVGSASQIKTLKVARGTVDVNLADFKVRPEAKVVKAGKVTFRADNNGDTKHELVVVRTNRRSGDLLKGSEADESGAVDEIEGLKPGEGGKLTVRLKPGHYVLLCNLPGHYKAGMFTDLTVR